MGVVIPTYSGIWHMHLANNEPIDLITKNGNTIIECSGDSMSVVEDVKALRKRLGIKKLRQSIPISEFEKAVIVGLRSEERHRTAQRARLHA